MALNSSFTIRDHEKGTEDSLRWEYALWYALGMLLSWGFVMKGGTVNYIFVLGEPAVALFAADASARLFRWIQKPSTETLRGFFSGSTFGSLKRVRFSFTTPILLVVFPLVMVGCFLSYPNLFKSAKLATTNIMLTLTKRQSEIPADVTQDMIEWIAAHTEPGDVILAPPFYAYLTDTTVAGELAENYLWQIKYYNETIVDGVEGEGTLKMREVARLLRNREVSVVLLDMKQTGQVPFIQDAAAQNYTVVDEFNTRNTPLLVMLPDGVLQELPVPVSPYGP
jgi:hypothetical protein